MKNILPKLLWLAALVLGYLLFIALIMEQYNNPPELARLSNLHVEYYTKDDNWLRSTIIPVTTRDLRLCGMMEKSKMATLQIFISEPTDRNVFITQDNYFFDLQPGEFCVNFSLTADEISPGNYILWVLDARNAVAKVDLTFFRK